MRAGNGSWCIQGAEGLFLRAIGSGRRASDLNGTGCASTRTRRGAWTSDRSSTEGAGSARHSTRSVSRTTGCERGGEARSCARPSPRAGSPVRCKARITGVADTDTTWCRSNGSISRRDCGDQYLRGWDSDSGVGNVSRWPECWRGAACRSALGCWAFLTGSVSETYASRCH